MLHGNRQSRSLCYLSGRQQRLEEQELKLFQLLHAFVIVEPALRVVLTRKRVNNPALLLARGADSHPIYTLDQHAVNSAVQAQKDG